MSLSFGDFQNFSNSFDPNRLYTIGEIRKIEEEKLPATLSENDLQIRVQELAKNIPSSYPDQKVIDQIARFKFLEQKNPDLQVKNYFHQIAQPLADFEFNRAMVNLGQCDRAHFPDNIAEHLQKFPTDPLSLFLSTVGRLVAHRAVTPVQLGILHSTLTQLTEETKASQPLASSYFKELSELALGQFQKRREESLDELIAALSLIEEAPVLNANKKSELMATLISPEVIDSIFKRMREGIKDSPNPEELYLQYQAQWKKLSQKLPQYLQMHQKGLWSLPMITLLMASSGTFKELQPELEKSDSIHFKDDPIHPITTIGAYEKYLLSTKSEYFKVLFSNQFKEEEITVEGIQASSFTELIDEIQERGSIDVLDPEALGKKIICRNRYDLPPYTRDHLTINGVRLEPIMSLYDSATLFASEESRKAIQENIRMIFDLYHIASTNNIKGLKKVTQEIINDYFQRLGEMSYDLTYIGRSLQIFLQHKNPVDSVKSFLDAILWYKDPIKQALHALGKERCGYLEEISLTGWSASNKTLYHIANHCPNLTSLTVSSEKITDKGIQFIARKCTRLTSLTLFSCLKITANGLSSLQNLVSLSIHYCRKMTIQGIKELTKRNPNLTTLSLRRVNDEDVKEITQSCPNLTSLEIFDYNPTITTAGLQSIIENCPKLSSLRLEGMGKITSEDFQSLAKKCEKLTSLSLDEEYDLSDDQIKDIIRLFPNLTTLSMRHCKKITNKSLEEIAKAYKELTYLDVSYCDQITDSKIQELFPKERCLVKHYTNTI